MNDRIVTLTKAVIEAKAALREAQAAAEPQPVDDWELRNPDGSSVKLSELFAGKPDLLLVHNMGKSCVYCTHWADGFRGHAGALNDRASFVLCSNDEPAIVGDFAKSRDWNFRCVSGAGSGFARAMGYMDDAGNPHPGISAFHKNADGSIVRTGTSPLGPGDDFCPTWAMFDLLKDGVGGWEPKYEYGESGGCGKGCGCH